MHRTLAFGTLITILKESYSIFTVSCMINLAYLTWDSTAEITMSVFAIFFLVVLVGFPVFYGVYLSRNFQFLNSKIISERHSKFYEDLDLRQGRSCLLLPIWFLVRRLMLSIIVVFV